MSRFNISTTYREAQQVLNGRDSRTIGNNTRLADLGPEGIALRLHSTYVVTFRPEGSLILRTGGWHTTTTKDRINRVIRAHGWTVYAKARRWYIAHRNGEPVEFEDGFIIPAHAPREPERDATVQHDGSSLFMVRPLNDASRDWLEEHTSEDAQWFGDALVVEHRFVADLVTGMRSAGFSVEAA